MKALKLLFQLCGLLVLATLIYEIARLIFRPEESTREGL